MVQKLLEQNIGIYVMVALCLFGMIGNFICSIGWNNLLKATEQIGVTKHKLVQEMKKRFETCYKLQINVNSVDKYVYKYIYKYKICGFHLYTWENICGQILRISAGIGVICSILLCVYDCGQDKILSYILTTVIISGMLITYQYRVNVTEKSKCILVNLEDYFENYLKVRLETEQSNPELLARYKKEWNDYVEDQTQVSKVKKEKKSKVKKDDRREEIEKLKQELVEELKQERLLQKQKEAKRLTFEMEEKAVKQGKEEVAAASAEQPDGKETRKEVSQGLKKEEEKLVQDILKEYLA